ncbi:MAG: transporter, partial [Alistipes sp.]|nr:transporter [Alistipes sp.]
MGLLHSLHRNVKTIAMPLGMVVGAALCRPVTALETVSHQMITPVLIFLMLFFTFCRVDVRQMRASMLHFWLLVLQLAGCAAVYLLLCRYDPVVAQGALICVLAPVAMAAVVIGGMLGANVTTMATYSLICNMVVALAAPTVLSLVGAEHCTFLGILSRVAPLLVLPFVCAQLCRAVLPRLTRWIAGHSQISFYMWLVSLVVVIGRTTAFILDLRNADPRTEIALALVALVICLLQFKLGRMLGRRYGDASAGGQSLGQKNTVLA